MAPARLGNGLGKAIKIVELILREVNFHLAPKDPQTKKAPSNFFEPDG